MKYYSYAIITLSACVAELVDALDSKSSNSDIVWVRVPPQAPFIVITNSRFVFLFAKYFINAYNIRS